MNFSPDHDDERISAFIDGQMTAEERAEFVAAMHADRTLQQRVEDFQRLSAELRDLPRQNLPEDFADRLLATTEFQRAWSERFGLPAAARIAGDVAAAPATGDSRAFSEWSVAIAAIGSLAAMLLLTLFWPALFDSDAPMVARRVDESPADSIVALGDRAASPAGESGERISSEITGAGESDDVVAGLMAKSRRVPPVEAESAMKVDSVEAFESMETEGPIEVASPGQTNQKPSGRMQVADVTENVAENDGGGVVQQFEPTSPRAQMARVTPGADESATDGSGGRGLIDKNGMDEWHSGALKGGGRGGLGRSDQVAGHNVEFDQALMTNNAWLMNGAASPLNVVQVEIPRTDDATDFVKDVFSSNQLVVMSNKMTLPPASELRQLADTQEHAGIESRQQKSSNLAGGQADGPAEGLDQAAPSPTDRAAGHGLANDIEALYTIASPEQMQKVVLDLSTRAQVSMFRLSEDELVQQVEALGQRPTAAAERDQINDKPGPLSDPAPTFILNFSQRMEMGPEKQSGTVGIPRLSFSASDAARSTSPDSRQMAQRAEEAHAANADSTSTEKVPPAIVPPSPAQRMDSDQGARPAGQTAQRNVPRNPPFVPEGVDPVQIRELNAYFQLPMPDEKDDESLQAPAQVSPRMEQFILLIRRTPPSAMSRPDRGNQDER